MIKLLLIVSVMLAGCTLASYKDAKYFSLFKGADSVVFKAADGTTMIVTGSKSDVKDISSIVNALVL